MGTSQNNLAILPQSASSANLYPLNKNTRQPGRKCLHPAWRPAILEIGSQIGQSVRVLVCGTTVYHTRIGHKRSVMVHL